MGLTNAVALQVRLDSVRMPRKALLPLDGKTVIEQAMLSLKRVASNYYLLLTDKDSANTLGTLADACGFQVFVGPKDNVLQRFVLAASKYSLDYFIRATGDNPLVSSEYAEESLRLVMQPGIDYVTYKGLPLGCGVEAVKAEALERALKMTDHSYDLEHVTPYIYKNPEKFNLHYATVSVCHSFSQLRLTLDTKEDYERIKFVVELFPNGLPISIDDLCAVLAKQDF